MAARKIIIDAAPGQDDAIGLMMALSSPDELEVVGITVVASRVPLDIALHNTRRVCEIAGRYDIAIHGGCDAPLSRPRVDLQRPDVDIGLDGYDGPAPAVAVQAGHAVDFIVDTLRQAEERAVTICCLGPLTNLATALRQAPELAARLNEVVIAAGSNFELGNITPVAEANAWVDPEAVAEVLASGVNCVIFPLDVAHRMIATPARLAELRELGRYPAEAAAAWADSMVRLYAERFGADGMPLHSICVIGFILRPYLFTGRRLNIEVETRSDLTRGATVVDWWGMTSRPPNALFMSQVDSEGLFSLLHDRIARI